jgi:ribosomal protein L7Ae-like RNA K-turn-binding protein
MDEGITGLVGLARRSGRLAVGFDACARAIGQRKAKLIILAQDLSSSTATKVRNRADERQVPLIVHGSKARWGKALGRDEVGVMAVLDSGFAEAIMRKLKNVNEVENRDL